MRVLTVLPISVYGKAERELTKRLQAAGSLYFQPDKGDYQIWRSPVTNKNFSMDAGVISHHNANGILKQAGLPRKF